RAYSKQCAANAEGIGALRGVDTNGKEELAFTGPALVYPPVHSDRLAGARQYGADTRTHGAVAGRGVPGRLEAHDEWGIGGGDRHQHMEGADWLYHRRLAGFRIGIIEWGHPAGGEADGFHDPNDPKRAASGDDSARDRLVWHRGRGQNFSCRAGRVFPDLY